MPARQGFLEYQGNITRIPLPNSGAVGVRRHTFVGDTGQLVAYAEGSVTDGIVHFAPDVDLTAANYETAAKGFFAPGIPSIVGAPGAVFVSFYHKSADIVVNTVEVR